MRVGGSKQGRPNVSSVPFFLSYFWQVQDRNVWPIYYTNSVNVMSDLNLWQPSGDLADDYVTYKRIHEELIRAFTTEAVQTFSLYDVEHVFWFQGGKATEIDKAVVKEKSGKEGLDFGHNAAGPFSRTEITIRLPESYVPPVVAISAKHCAQRTPPT